MSSFRFPILILALLTLPLGSAAEPRVVTDRYVAGFTNDCALAAADDLLVGDGGISALAPAEAAAQESRSCFAIEPDESRVTLAFADDRGVTVAFWYSFSTPQGNVNDIACGNVAALEIPAGATSLDVVVYPYAPGCIDLPATSGTVTATFV